MAGNASYLLRKEEYTRLTQNQSYIRENMDYDFMNSAMDRLYQYQLVTYKTYQDFDEMTRTSTKAEALLDLLITGNSHRYDAFCDFCKEEHPELYEKLFISDYNAASGPRIDTDSSVQGANADEANTDAALQPESPPASLLDFDKQSPGIEISVIPVISSHIIAKASKTKSVYTPSFPVRGIALLFFNIDFIDRNFPRRTGAEHDLDNLKRLFHQLNYNVKVFKNFTRAEMLKELECERQNRAHANFGSLVLGISTHGGSASQSLACSDGKTIYLQEIYDCFDSLRCPYLAGKPKFVFIDASFGCARDRAVAVDRVMQPPKTFEPVKKQSADIHFSLGNIRIGSMKPVQAHQGDLISLNISSSASSSCRVPEKSDFIVALSTFDGYVSWRRNSHGCWFSRLLVEIFQKHACDCHVVELLRMVRKKMSYIQTRTGYKQVNTTLDSSLKAFYFFPGMNQ